MRPKWSRGRRWRLCNRCSCPLTRMWLPGGVGERERRSRCFRCEPFGELATPCAVRTCLGAVVSEGSLFCPACLLTPTRSDKPLKCSCGSCAFCKQRERVKAWRLKNAEKAKEMYRNAYEKSREYRAKVASEKRKFLGNAMRLAERKKYAEAKGEPVRQYRPRRGVNVGRGSSSKPL